MFGSGQFKVMDKKEFFNWLMATTFVRRITKIQNHHTYLPNYASFTGTNHIAMLDGMKEYHTTQAKMSDIAQNLTTFPDGLIAICRSFEKAPAVIAYVNTGALCIEHVGNFDAGKDVMSDNQKSTILFLNAALALKFSIAVSTENIIYHHWFALSDGSRHDGLKDSLSKTCPGTAFFGGNNRTDADKYFIPKIEQEYIKLKYPEWQVDCSKYLTSIGLTPTTRRPDDVITFGLFGFMMIKYYEPTSPLDPIQFLLNKGIMKNNHASSEAMSISTLGYVLMNIDKVTDIPPMDHLLKAGYITTPHTATNPLTIWLFGAIIKNKPFKKPL